MEYTSYKVSKFGYDTVRVRRKYGRFTVRQYNIVFFQSTVLHQDNYELHSKNVRFQIICDVIGEDWS